MSVYKRPIRLALALALGFATSGAALAAVNALQVEKDRHGNFHKLGDAFKGVNDQLKADKPDTGLMVDNAKAMTDLAHRLPTWFPAGSGPEAGIKTRAKSEIWTDNASFVAAARGLETESAKLASLAKGGDIEAIKAQVRATGGACKTCHDKFRGPELDKDHEH